MGERGTRGESSGAWDNLDGMVGSRACGADDGRRALLFA